eukprot:INCI17195.2.p1 GENE.INCI17195.2~~INCI17195.2.p1  ORF type:complete len:623 (-),score=66.83 INCI17195.2:81-1949(-)
MANLKTNRHHVVHLLMIVALLTITSELFFARVVAEGGSEHKLHSHVRDDLLALAHALNHHAQQASDRSNAYVHHHHKQLYNRSVEHGHGMLIESVSARAAILAQMSTFLPRNDAILDGIRTCRSNITLQPSHLGKVYVTQDYTGGGGIGNLILKINAGLSFAISNGFEYLLPPLLPFGHNESEMYKNFFPHALHDAVMLTADAVLQLECIHKSEQNTSVAFKSILTVPYFTDDSLLVFRYGSTKRLARFFPDVTADWVALGGSEIFPDEEWKGVPGKRCAPSETLANCDRVQWHAIPALLHRHSQNAPYEARSKLSGEDLDSPDVFVLRLPGHLKYHANFSLSAPVFRAAYAATQEQAFQTSWATMTAAHKEIEAQCKAQGHPFVRIGVHIRLGDMAEIHSNEEREEAASATPDGLRWGTKYNSPRMHIGGLDIVWGMVPPTCSRVVVVTDGFADDPEMKFFFRELEQHPHAQSLLRKSDTKSRLNAPRVHIGPQCIFDPLNEKALSLCPLLFFNRTVISSMETLGLLAHTDVVVASGSQFSRVASMLGGNVLLNPNYGYIPNDHLRIPTDLSNTYKHVLTFQSKLERTQERRQQQHRQHLQHVSEHMRVSSTQQFDEKRNH